MNKQITSPYFGSKNMKRQKNQNLIFTDLEFELLQNSFRDNEDLLYAIRAVLCQFDVTESDIANIKNNLTKETVYTIKKRMHPENLNDYPFGQLYDLKMTLNQDLNQRRYDDTYPLIRIKELEIEYLDQQFKALESIIDGGNYEEKLKIEEMVKVEDNEEKYLNKYINISCRNYLLSYIDKMLQLIQSIAGNKKETVEEMKERLTRNSNK